jgi:RimJ/RimL family protein N-acetyltransferase
MIRLRHSKKRIEQASIETRRLLLRRFELSDAADVQRLANDKRVVSNLRSLPYPYEYGEAMRWIGTQQDNFKNGKSANFAITSLNSGDVLGSIGLLIDKVNESAELGYWLGVEYWGNGYCTEAAAAVLQYGFERLKLHRICAHHMLRNPASGRVLQKIGLRREGHLRGHLKKYGVFEDIVVYGILRDEFPSAFAKEKEADKRATTGIQNLHSRTCPCGLLPAVLE